MDSDSAVDEVGGEMHPLSDQSEEQTKKVKWLNNNCPVQCCDCLLEGFMACPVHSGLLSKIF